MTDEERIKLYNGYINDTIKAAQEHGEFRKDIELDYSARMDLVKSLDIQVGIIQKFVSDDEVIAGQIIPALIGFFLRGYDGGITQAEGK